MKVHHYRSEGKKLVMGSFVDEVVTYCGQMWYTEERTPMVDREGAVSKIPADQHCKRCLVSKRKHKGDAYMLEHGYPLLDHPLKGVLP